MLQKCDCHILKDLEANTVIWSVEILAQGILAI